LFRIRPRRFNSVFPDRRSSHETQPPDFAEIATNCRFCRLTAIFLPERRRSSRWTLADGFAQESDANAPGLIVQTSDFRLSCDDK